MDYYNKNRKIKCDTIIPLRFLKKSKEHFLNNYSLNYISSGASREVYDDYLNIIPSVIKFPKDWGGAFCNIMEYLIYKHYKHTGRLAKCDLIFHKGIPFLIMERLTDIYGTEENFLNMPETELEEITRSLPYWARKLLDGPQVGYNEHGKLLCYDYSNNYSPLNPRISKELKTLLIKTWEEILKFKEFHGIETKQKHVE